MLCDIPGFEGRYAASPCGSIWSHLSRKFLKQFVGSDGYPWASLSDGKGTKKPHRVARLVASTFICKPPTDRPHVNHIDGVKTNSNASNLEWVSQAENYRHSIDVLGYPPLRNPGKPILRISPTGEVRRYKCGMDAVRDGFTSSAISDVCRGKSKAHKGFFWKFA